MATRSAFGFKIHTGWAMLVAVTGQPDRIEVLIRLRIELLPSDGPIPRFVYHEAAQLPLSQAATLVKRAEEASQKSARLALKAALDELDAPGASVEVCGVLAGSTVVPDDLSQILRSHPLIHAAEGALFVQAIVSACKSRGIIVTSTQDRTVWPRAAAAWGVSEPSLRKKIDDLRKSIGPPWSVDHKLATAIALLALKV